MDSWALGIDIGTSRSAGAMADGVVTPLEVEGNRWMSSMVLLDQTGTLIVGVAAADQAEIHPDRVERTPKAHLGSPTPLLLGGTPVDPADAIARLIEVFLAEGRRRRDGQDPVATVLTHPVRWGEDRKAALVDAAGRAGLDAPRLYDEPVAAAVHYVDERVAEGAYVGIYDLGGGTFDTAVLQRTRDGFAVVGPPGGDEFIGGEHFDHLVFDYLGACLADADPDLWEQVQYGEDRRWVRAAAELLEQARRAKEAVSAYPSTQVLLPLIDRDVVFTRRQFEDMIRVPLETTVTAMAATIDGAGLAVEDLSAIYLVGGSSRIPLVTDLMTARFGDRIATRDEPKSVVALGAATIARDLAQKPDPGPAGSGAPGRVGLTPRWRVDLGATVHGIAHGTTGLWATLSGDTLHHLDHRGAWRWSVPLPGTVYGPPVPAGDVVLVGSAAHAVVAFDQTTGAVGWRASTQAPVVPAPVVAHDAVLAVDDQGMAAAFGRADGVLRWLLPLGTNVRAPLVVHGPLALIAGLDGKVFRVDPATGQVAWAFPVPASVTAAPLVIDDLVILASTEGVVYGVEGGPGTARWGTRPGGPVDGSMGVWQDTVVVADRSGTLSIVATTDGTVRWQTPTGGPNPTGVVVTGDLAVLDNGAGEIVAVDLAARGETGRVAVEPGAWQPPVVDAGGVLVVSATTILALTSTR